MTAGFEATEASFQKIDDKIDGQWILLGNSVLPNWTR